ncbi:protein PAM68, chloroplastic [Silene latifolia]|uniref:protein PAM68, chloroplastic n=1 Tax=Silene latifolia TaxID=37657 RepID=UPI003D787E3C
METCSFHGALPLISPQNLSYTKFSTFLWTTKHPQNLFLLSNKSTSLHATLKSPKGFGAPKKKKKNNKNLKDVDEEEDDDDDDNDNDDDDREEGVIPEIVTNRMISRMGFSVGIPLFTGLAFFPFFYYLKVGLKIDVPTWVPFIVSFVFFGTALLGVSYGIVSSSWDPLREGSFWGWTEAQKNWPVFWQSFRGGSSSSKK